MATDFAAVAKNARAFLDRADLKGSEAPAFAEVANMLAAIAHGKLVVVAPELSESPPPKAE